MTKNYTRISLKEREEVYKFHLEKKSLFCCTIMAILIIEFFILTMNLLEENVMLTALNLSGVIAKEDWQSLMD